MTAPNLMRADLMRADLTQARPVDPREAAPTKGVDAPTKSGAAPMKAVVASGYGGTEVLTISEQPRPTPGAHEVLIQVYAAGVNAADGMMRRGDPAYARLFLGVRRPKHPIPGTGMSGVVRAVGEEVTRFAVGDEVFGETGVSFGAHAEYVCVPEDGVLLPKPATLSFADAALMCDGPMTSWNFLKRMAQLEPGQRVLINGAAGSLGTAAVQLAKAFGAHVTAVCSARNHELVRSLGADAVIDYTEVDFARTGETWDVIYDTVGKRSFGDCAPALTPKGQYLSPVLNVGLLLRMAWTRLVGGKRARFDATGLRKPDELRGFLESLLTLVADGRLRLVTERTYPLDQIAAAHAHVDSGHKRGNLVLQVVD